MLSKKVDIWAEIHFSKVFDNVGRILTGLKFSLISFLPFLLTGVTSANFKKEGKVEVLIALFMPVYKKSTNIENKCQHIFIVSQIYFLSGYWLVREQRLYCFPKFLIIYNIYLIPILLIFYFSFFQERHTFIPLFYIKLAGFFCFLS